MLNSLLILTGKSFSVLSRLVNKGSGSTWPGHIALSTNQHFIKDIIQKNNLKIILIAGTNGKTTTALMIRAILEKNGHNVIHNESGANLINGIASSLIHNSNATGTLKADWAVFEIDENSLPLVLEHLTPSYLVVLNLFRDQLDRYGEVNTIAKKWTSAIKKLSSSTTLILNADDPQIAYLSQCHPELDSGSRVFYFGLSDKKLGQTTHQHAVDSTYCPNCSTKLTYETTYYSHLGDWKCNNCKLSRPKLSFSKVISPLPGVYNLYNTLAAYLTTQTIGIHPSVIDSALQNFEPAFGRQEIIQYQGKRIQIFLSKNPTSFNQSLRTISELNARHILIVLNDRIPDGRDVSWIWDVDFEEYLNDTIDVSVAGDRTYDMGLRLKYSHPNVLHVDGYYPRLDYAIQSALEKVKKDETLYILPTYSAMLEVRKILTGKKIL